MSLIAANIRYFLRNRQFTQRPAYLRVSEHICFGNVRGVLYTNMDGLEKPGTDICIMWTAPIVISDGGLETPAIVYYNDCYWAAKFNPDEVALVYDGRLEHLSIITLGEIYDLDPSLLRTN
jgi:hypothetical protein